MAIRSPVSAAISTALVLLATSLAVAQSSDKAPARSRPHPAAVLRVEAGARQKVRFIHSTVQLYPESEMTPEFAAPPLKSIDYPCTGSPGCS